LGVSDIKRPVLKGSNRLRGASTLQTSLVWVSRLLRLDFAAFDEIRGEPTATTSAVLVVYVASLFAGAGSWLWAVQSRELLDETDIFIQSLIIGSFMQAVVWFGWVYLTYQIAVHAYDSDVHFVELTRTMGYAFAPVALSVLIAIAPLAVPFGLLAFGLALLLTTAAIQSAAELEQRDAIIANIAGFSLFVIAMGVLANVREIDNIGGTSPGILFFSLDL
jgi:hypothetical protein